MVPRRPRLLAGLNLLYRVLVDGILPVLAPLLLVREAAAGLLADPMRWVAAPMIAASGDGNGEAWFYWWMERAVRLGLDVELPRVVCAPEGAPLLNNFATRVDAWIALPFFARYPFPLSFNLAAMAVPIVNAWLVWLGLRAARTPWAAAVLGGLVIGASEHVFNEVSRGHSANALIGPAFAFLGAWSAVAEGRWGWAPVAAAAGALTVAAYPPFAVVILPVAALFGLGGLRDPARRRRVLLGAIAVGAVVAYAAWAQVQDLHARGFAHHGANALAMHWTQLVADSLPLGWLGERAETFKDRYVAFGPALLVGLGAGLVAGWRGRGWVAATAWFWVSSLGVIVLHRTGAGLAPWKPFGSALALPLYAAIDALPALAEVRPYRFAPFVAGALVFALGSLARWGAEAFAAGERGGAPSSPAPPQPTLWRPRLGVAAGVAVVALLGLALQQQRASGHLVYWRQAWTVPAPLQWLAEQPDDFAVVELPAGLGHAYGPYQVVHGKARSEGHHDAGLDALASPEAPTACYTDALVRALWGLERGVPLPTERAGMLRAARAAGYRYVVVYEDAYHGVGDPRRLVGLELALEAAFGAAVREGDHVRLYAIPEPTPG